MLLLDLPGQRLVLLRCCRHLPFFQTVVEAVDLRDRLEDRVSVLRRHGIEFPDAALAVHFFGRTQIGVQLAQRGGSGIFVSAHRVQIATILHGKRVDLLAFVSAHRVQIATSSSPVSLFLRPFVSAHRVQIATSYSPVSLFLRPFVSAHRVQIATAEVADLALYPVLCLSAPRADRNLFGRYQHDAVPLCLSAPRADRNTLPPYNTQTQALCLSAPRADRNGKCAQSTACGFVECAVSR